MLSVADWRGRRRRIGSIVLGRVLRRISDLIVAHRLIVFCVGWRRIIYEQTNKLLRESMNE